MSTSLLNRQNTPVSTRLPAEKYPGLHGYPSDILIPYIVIHRGFSGLSGSGKDCQGMGLWYFAKLMGYLLFKILGMSSRVRISERSNQVPKSEPNFSIRRFEKNIKIAQKCTFSFGKYFRIIAQRGNMTSSRTSNFADNNTTIGDNYHRYVIV